MIKLRVPGRWLAGRSEWRDTLSLMGGTFLLAFAFLSFEITTVRTINFIMGPGYIYFAIAIGMLGFSAAGSLLSLADLRSYKTSRDVMLFWVCLGAALLILAAHFLAAGAKAELNAAVEAAGRESGLTGAVVAMAGLGLLTALKTGFVLSLPYFLIGVGLAILFATIRPRAYAPVYAADLIGAAAGCIGAVVIMETTGYAWSVTLPAAAAVAAGAVFAAGARARLALAGSALAALVLLLPLAGPYARGIEPPADPHYLVRDYAHKWDVRELWRGWNSYTRIGAVEHRREEEETYAVMSIGNSDGMAWLMPYSGEGEDAAGHDHLPAVIAQVAGPAKKVLVLMAGAGADLRTFVHSGGEDVEATGVELNDDLVRGALSLEKFRLKDFLAKDNVNLEVSEGRVFLERDKALYDVILLSYSGASASYYAGMHGATTQGLFTLEGLSAVWDRLSPDGHAVIMQLNKLRALGALRRYLDRNGIPDPARTAVVLFEPDGFPRNWHDPWDNNPLLVKLRGWTDEEVERIERNAHAIGWEVAYAPGRGAHPKYEVYERVLKADDYVAELAAIGREAGKRLDIVTDNTPFFLDTFRTDRYFTPSFWMGLSGGTDDYQTLFQLVRSIFVLTIIFAGAFLILVPLFLRKGPRPTARNAGHLAYFVCLGAGFMTLEIALMQKAALVFGNPALTISLLLSGIILFTGIGSMLSSRSFSGRARFHHIAAGVAVYGLVLALTLDWVLHAVLAWPLLARAIAVYLIVAPGAIMMGHLFPQGLAVIERDDPALIPWAWGINGALGTAAAGAAPLLAQAVGINALFVIGGAFYALILVLGPYRPGVRREAAQIAEGSAA